MIELTSILRNSRSLLTAAVAAWLALVPVAIHAGAGPARFDADGALLLPEGWREWVFIGATVTPDDMNYGAAYSPGIKHAYIDPQSFAHWKRTGTFRTGAVIVQERLDTGVGEFMNAQGYFSGKYLGLQAMVKDTVRFPESVWGFFSFGKPPYAKKVYAIPGMGELDCAGCHARADHDWVFTRFYPVLKSAASDRPMGKHSEGKALFERNWTPATASAADDARTGASHMGDGLGPLFHTRSCNACHPEGGRGKFAVRADGVIEGDGLLLRVGVGKSGDPAYGRQIQTRAVAGLRAEAVPAVRFEAVSHPSGRTLGNPVFQLRQPAYGGLHPATRITGRVAPAIRGSGALEKVPVEALKALADPDDRNGDGISGRLNRIELPMGRWEVGRYGWKAGQWSIEMQVTKAFRMDMGLSSRLMGPAWGDCTPVQTKCREAPNGERAWKGGHEVADEAIAKVTAYVANLPAPARRGSETRGAKIFAATGCAACHAPSLPLLDGGAVHAYTDLLLHDMGEGLADGIEEGSSTGSEWRTAPLMGLGRLIEKRAPLLHDGRARTVVEAILWHGGEAKSAAGAYRNLAGDRRRSLHRFLKTL